MMPLHDDPCIWPQAGCTCPFPEVKIADEAHFPKRRFIGKRPELAMGYGMSSLRFPTWWHCRCSACEQQRQEKDQDLYAQIANGGC